MMDSQKKLMGIDENRKRFLPKPPKNAVLGFVFFWVVPFFFKNKTIDAAYIDNEIETRLIELERFFYQAALAGEKCCKFKYARQHKALKSILITMESLRIRLNDFKSLNVKHREYKAHGDDKKMISVNLSEAFLFDEILDIHERVTLIRVRQGLYYQY